MSSKVKELKEVGKVKKLSDYKEEIKKSLKELKVIYSDLDGTLLNQKGCLIKDENDCLYLESIEELVEILKRGWDVVLVSGRNRTQLKYNAQFIGVNNYIAELGCELVYNLGEKIYQTFDTQNVDYDLGYGGKDLATVVKLLKESFPDRLEYNPEWSKYRSWTVLLFGDIDLDLANEKLRENGFDNLILVDNGLTSLVKLDIGVNRLHIYNLIPEGVDKSSGIRLDKKLRRLETENCIALGDSLEDLKMAKEVKFFFLMRNAFDFEGGKKILDELQNYDNVFVTEGRMNRGWTEVMRFVRS